MASSPAAVLGVAAGCTLFLTGIALAALRPPRKGINAFAVYALLVGAGQAVLNLSFILERPLLHALSWPLLGMAAVALALAILHYEGLPHPSVVWAFVVAAAVGAGLVLWRGDLMLYPNGGPSNIGVVLWQMPQFAATAVGAWVLTRSLRRERSEELRTEGLLLLLALLPYMGYTSGVSIVVASRAPGPVQVWMWAYWITFGGCLVVSALCCAWLWRSGAAARGLATFTAAVTLVGILQSFVLTEFVLFGGALRILAALALGYGLLKFGLFGTDLHLKWSLDRGALLAVFGGVFFLVDQAAQYFVSSTFGTIAGFAAAIGLLVLLKPLQRMTARLADRVFPHVDRTPEYVESRRLLVYRSAAQAAAKDGVITEREREMLAALVRELGLSAGEVAAVERELARPVLVA